MNEFRCLNSRHKRPTMTLEVRNKTTIIDMGIFGHMVSVSDLNSLISCQLSSFEGKFFGDRLSDCLYVKIYSGLYIEK